jgi:hypothetical protein
VKDNVFAMRAGSVPAALAASSTVALDSLKVMILSSMPNRDRNFLARSTDMFLTPFRFRIIRPVFS